MHQVFFFCTCMGLKRCLARLVANKEACTITLSHARGFPTFNFFIML